MFDVQIECMAATEKRSKLRVYSRIWDFLGFFWDLLDFSQKVYGIREFSESEQLLETGIELV